MHIFYIIVTGGCLLAEAVAHVVGGTSLPTSVSGARRLSQFVDPFGPFRDTTADNNTLSQPPTNINATQAPLSLQEDGFQEEEQGDLGRRRRLFQLGFAPLQTALQPGLGVLPAFGAAQPGYSTQTWLGGARPGYSFPGGLGAVQPGLGAASNTLLAQQLANPAGQLFLGRRLAQQQGNLGSQLRAQIDLALVDAIAGVGPVATQQQPVQQQQQQQQQPLAQQQPVQLVQQPVQQPSQPLQVQQPVQQPIEQQPFGRRLTQAQVQPATQVPLMQPQPSALPAAAQMPTTEPAPPGLGTQLRQRIDLVLLDAVSSMGLQPSMLQPAEMQPQEQQQQQAVQLEPQGRRLFQRAEEASILTSTRSSQKKGGLSGLTSGNIVALAVGTLSAATALATAGYVMWSLKYRAAASPHKAINRLDQC